MACSTPALAAGSSASQFTDPNATSPAGAMYQIPLDTARQDAAPHGHYYKSGSRGSGRAGGSSAGGTAAIGAGIGAGGGGGTSGGGGGTGGSVGTGSGASVGGGGTAASGRTGSAGGALSSSAASTGAAPNTSDVLIPGGQPGSLVHSGNGFGSSSQVPGYSAPASIGFRAVGTDASDAPVLAILLALLVVGLGVFAGARAWHVNRRASGPSLAPLPPSEGSPPAA